MWPAKCSGASEDKNQCSIVDYVWDETGRLKQMLILVDFFTEVGLRKDVSSEIKYSL